MTTQAEVRAVLGAPTDLQTTVRQGQTHETWGYAKAGPFINPLQYLPLVGVLALPRRQEPEAMAISFASDGIVDGVSIRDVQPYGDVTSAEDRVKAGSEVTSYGMNNPMIHAWQPNPTPRSKALAR